MDTMSLTIAEAIENYLYIVQMARSANTSRAYRNAMIAFRSTLALRGLPTQTTNIANLDETVIAWFCEDLKAYSPATENLYLTAAAGFFEYLSAEKLAEVNLPRMRLLIRQRARRPGQRLPQFPRDDIDTIIDYANNIAESMKSNCAHDEKANQQMLRTLRDRAFLITLADTGLRVHEICRLRRGDIDWNEGKAVIIGKGNREDVVRISSRSLRALREYLNTRNYLDSSTGKPLTSLPVFARHDRGAGKKVKPITTRTGQNIINHWSTLALGRETAGLITPHSFRHYFVTRVLMGSGNLKLAQILARHRNIAVTQRYAHIADDELDRGYFDIFENS